MTQAFKRFATALALVATMTASPAFAQTTAAKIDGADTAWMIAATALVLMMTIPGLALFYAGMVRKKNVLATMAQSLAATFLVSILWAFLGYSLAFTGEGAFIGTLERAFLNGLTIDSISPFAKTIPESLFMLYQMTFAVITVALVAGSVADRLRFSAFLLFCVFWLFLVYVPLAHWVWGIGGWIRNLGALDFAGGLVVHVSSGISALAAAFVLWQSLTYTGLVLRLGEWQFDRFERYFPTLTFIALTALFSLPALVALALVRRRDGDTPPPEAVRRANAIDAATQLMRLLFAVGVVGVGAAIASLLMLVTLPTSAGAPRDVRVGTAEALAPEEGHVRLVGTIGVDRVARFDESLLVIRREIFVAPVIDRGQQAPLRYFVMLQPIDAQARRFAPVRPGILRQAALPREIVHLYRRARYAVADTPYLLFASDRDLRWRYIVFAGEALVLALVALLFAEVQRRRRDRLAREFADPSPIG